MAPAVRVSRAIDWLPIAMKSLTSSSDHALSLWLGIFDRYEAVELLATDLYIIDRDRRL